MIILLSPRLSCRQPELDNGPNGSRTATKVANAQRPASARRERRLAPAHPAVAQVYV